MSARLEWRVGPDGSEDAGMAAQPETVLPRRSRRRLALTPRFVGLYLAALLCAGWVGFGIGRWSEARAVIGAELERQLGVESLAWQQADADLLRSTLDPEAPGQWRAALLATLAQESPSAYVARALSFEVQGPDQVRVTVQLSTASGPRTEERLYRAVGRTWYRTPWALTER